MKRFYIIAPFFVINVNILGMWNGQTRKNPWAQVNKRAEKYHNEQMEKACKQFEKNNELKTFPKIPNKNARSI